MGTTDAPGGEQPVPDLVEPARQQLLVLADDLLGRLPGDEVPSSLRPFARFAPAKRRRLAAAALAATLDADETFRGAVADAVRTASPELVTAVADGSTVASDPVDVAVVAYLTRPDGWHDVVAAAAARWRDDRVAGTVDTGELDALRMELSRLRSDAKGEAARLRKAADDAVADVRDELTSLRRTVRDRTRELRAAERERDDALAAAREAAATTQELLAERDDRHAEELRRLQERAADADRAVAAARRGARTERDVDDARLWLLVDTLVQAAAGVRRELSLSAPTARPADGVAASDVAGAGRTVHDPAAVEAVLALPHAHLIVDGYNVTKTGYPELALADQRTRLTGSLAALAARTGAEVTVAFDGAGAGQRPPAQPPAPRGVRVLFSAADEIADDLIRRLVGAEPAGRAVLVVTSDQQIVRDTARAGVWSAPAAVLLARLG